MPKLELLGVIRQLLIMLHSEGGDVRITDFSLKEDRIFNELLVTGEQLPWECLGEEAFTVFSVLRTGTRDEPSRRSHL